jgi:hypothetical protein
MLGFALEYEKAISAIVDKQKLGLGAHDLQEYEWTLIQQLHDVLKVQCYTSHCNYVTNTQQILKDVILFFSH